MNKYRLIVKGTVKPFFVDASDYHVEYGSGNTFVASFMRIMPVDEEGYTRHENFLTVANLESVEKYT